jgi:hypothetical protein
MEDGRTESSGPPDPFSEAVVEMANLKKDLEQLQDKNASLQNALDDALCANNKAIMEDVQTESSGPPDPEAEAAVVEMVNLKNELEQLQDKNASLQNALDDALSEVAVAGCIKEDLVELQRQKNGLEDEKTTLESLLIESREELTSTRTRYEHECARNRAVIDQLDTENRELRGGGFKSGHPTVTEFADGGAANLETLSVISDATKSLARRVRSNLMPNNASTCLVTTTSTQTTKDKSEESANAADSSPTDPTGMQRAFEDAEVLKSIIVPMEEQIGALKDKLRQTDSLLREMEVRTSESLYSAEVLGR